MSSTCMYNVLPVLLCGGCSFEPRPRGAMSNLVPVSQPAAAAVAIGNNTIPPGKLCWQQVIYYQQPCWKKQIFNDGADNPLG